jgi:tRNA dimethylallyltransferase
MTPTPDAWFLTGPTAAGKSAVGVALAQRIGAEIVSLDSMALYRGMDIGTAKPTAADRGAVPHHLIDVLDPWEEYSVAQYVEAAARCAVEIAGRGRLTLFVGGTPLYLKALLRGIFEGPPADWDFRRRMADEARRHGDDWLHRRLAEVDQAAAARLHPNDVRRILRALEVFEKTGRPISELQRQFETGRPAAECRVFVLDWPRAELHARIDRRVEAMFAAGLVDEVRRLCASGPLSLWERANTSGPLSLREKADMSGPLSLREKADVSGPLSLREKADMSGPLSLWERVRVRADTTEDNPPMADASCDFDRPHPRPLSRKRESGEYCLSRTALQAVGYREVIEYLEGRRSSAETIELVQCHTRQLAKRQMTWFRSLSECRFSPVSEPFDPLEVANRIEPTHSQKADI